MAEPRTSERTPDSIEPSGLIREQSGASAPADVSAEGDLPDWAPQLVLAGLLLLGVLGALGAVPLPRAVTATAKTTLAAAQPKPAPNSASAAPAGSVDPDKERVTVSHLVVSYKDTALGQKLGLTRTREEARQRALEALGRARKGEDFAKLVAEYSDEPGAAARKGAVGRMARKFAVKGFEKAFDLKVGEISDLVETQFGFHVIWRTE
jgi:hypothetical protein